MLKGGGREGEIIDDEYVIHLRDCTNQHWAFWRFGLVNNFFMDNANEAFVAIFCYGRGVWFPATEANDTIDKIADVRSGVTQQWLMFTNVMSRARTAITLLRDMQQLIGNVERITGMLDMLDRIREAKSLQKKASTVTADRIEFKDVTVVTPADVLLVEKLSFRLENGQSLLLVGHNGSGKSSICTRDTAPSVVWIAAADGVAGGGVAVAAQSAASAACGRSPTAAPSPSRRSSTSSTYRRRPTTSTAPSRTRYTRAPPLADTCVSLAAFSHRWRCVSQLTYPETAADTDIGKDEKRLKEILQQVDLEYLLERPNALTQPMAWGEHDRLHRHSQVGEVVRPMALCCREHPLARREATRADCEADLPPAALRHSRRVLLGHLDGDGAAPLPHRARARHHLHHDRAVSAATVGLGCDCCHPVAALTVDRCCEQPPDAAGLSHPHARHRRREARLHALRH